MDPFIIHFFRCNINAESALFPASGQTAHIFGKTPFFDSGKAILQ